MCYSRIILLVRIDTCPSSTVNYRHRLLFFSNPPLNACASRLSCITFHTFLSLIYILRVKFVFCILQIYIVHLHDFLVFHIMQGDLMSDPEAGISDGIFDDSRS